MGRLDANPPPQSSNQTPFQAPPQGYPNHHDNPLAPPQPAPAPSPAPAPALDTYVADNDQNNNHPQTTARSFVPQSSPESMPPPESYPPQKPSTYPPQQPAAAYPPQPTPVQFPPQQEPVQFPPPQQHTNAQAHTPQSNFNYAPQPQPMNYVGQQGYQTPMKDGIPVASQFLAPTQGWTTDIFDCAEDPENAIITACFPCITFGQIAEILNNGQTSCATSGLLYGVVGFFIGMPCIMSCSYRTKIRSRYGLMESPGPDWVTHFFASGVHFAKNTESLKPRFGPCNRVARKSNEEPTNATNAHDDSPNEPNNDVISNVSILLIVSFLKLCSIFWSVFFVL